MQEAIADHLIPGAVVVVGYNGRVVYRKAFGHRALEPHMERMTLDTVFDMASLTKGLVTATAVMQLLEKGRFRLNDPVSRYIPEFASNGKEEITIRQLLTHFSGLPPDLDLASEWQGKSEGLRRAYEEKPIAPPGARFIYSDINYIILGDLVERISAMPLERYAQTHILAPLKMNNTRFLPPASWNRRIAPTQYDERNVMLRGVVHDPTARRMGGVAGHAGLFSTASDVARYAQATLRRSTVISPLAMEKMSTPQQPPNSTILRGIGWDIDSPFSSNRGELLPVGSFGHTGFTGTSLWMDPFTNTYIIILANAVHPRGSIPGAPMVALRARVANALAVALNLRVDEGGKRRLAAITGYNEAAAGSRRLASRNGTVLTGLDALEAHNFDVVRAADPSKTRAVGLVTNQTGLDSQGRRTIDVLAQAPGIKLSAIFSPEHGPQGALDTTEIGNTRDQATGIPIYSVYGSGEESRHPPMDVVKTLDAIVYDIQDAGVRFYTYETTLGYFLEAVAKAGNELIVLDRPNPITGSMVQGPIADAELESFVTYHTLPVRHGMTVGELARLFNAERNIHARLTVVPMQGWIPGDWFDSTGLAWVNPSPNLRSLTEAALYPGVALVEGTNVSVGRGTDTPFEVLGAPWIEPRALADYLNRREIAGVRFVPIYFTPSSSRYGNQRCGGVNILLVDRAVLEAPELGIELASALRRLYPQEFKIDRMIELLANRAAYEAIVSGQDPRRIADDWREPLEKFQEMRKKYLLYK